MPIEFTAHNILLDNGVYTRPETGISMKDYPWFVSARKLLDTVFPGEKNHLRIADIGCLEGGYAVEFARMGFQVLGLEVRESNMAACRFVKENTDLPNLQFEQDNAWNIARYGHFDAVFCCGLLYHLDRPKQFLQTLSAVTARLLILQTHFSVAHRFPADRFPRRFRRIGRNLSRLLKFEEDKFNLSPITENEGLRGRWFLEFSGDKKFGERESAKWASWDNSSSFWVQREYLIQTVRDVGFDLVMEQFDSLGPDIADAMIRGYYKTESRGTFIGIKTFGKAVHCLPAG